MTGELATPDEFVATVTEVPPNPNVRLAPLFGAVNVTSTPLKGVPLESLTCACKTAGKGEPIVADWPPPERAMRSVCRGALIVMDLVAVAVRGTGLESLTDIVAENVP
jgi:hypothetical protein